LTKTYTYDQNSNLVSETNENGETISYTYDKLNRKKKISYVSLNEELTRVNVTLTKEYDNMGNLIKSVDALGNITTNKYSLKGNFEQVIQTRKINGVDEKIINVFHVRAVQSPSDSTVGSFVTVY
jgi:YD repeat-containing protein